MQGEIKLVLRVLFYPKRFLLIGQKAYLLLFLTSIFELHIRQHIRQHIQQTRWRPSTMRHFWKTVSFKGEIGEVQCDGRKGGVGGGGG